MEGLRQARVLDDKGVDRLTYEVCVYICLCLCPCACIRNVGHGYGAPELALWALIRQEPVTHEGVPSPALGSSRCAKTSGA